MNSEDDARLAAASHILANLHLYLCCEGCGSILRRTILTNRTIACPVCNAYSFDSDPAHVIDQAKKLLVNGRTSVQKHDLP